jgi:hypothetical protein
MIQTARRRNAFVAGTGALKTLASASDVEWQAMDRPLGGGWNGKEIRQA